MVRKNDELWKLVGESDRTLWYVSNHCRAISKSKATDKARELTPYMIHGGYVVCIHNEAKGLYKLTYETFVKKVPKGYRVKLIGEPHVKNLKLVLKAQSWIDSHKKKVAIDGVEYESISECARKNYYSPKTVSHMLKDNQSNTLGVEYIE